MKTCRVLVVLGLLLVVSSTRAARITDFKVTGSGCHFKDVAIDPVPDLPRGSHGGRLIRVSFNYQMDVDSDTLEKQIMLTSKISELATVEPLKTPLTGAFLSACLFNTRCPVKAGKWAVFANGLELPLTSPVRAQTHGIEVRLRVGENGRSCSLAFYSHFVNFGRDVVG